MGLVRYTVQLSDESRAGWQAVCDIHRLHLSSLMEAFGLALGSHADKAPHPDFEAIVQDAVRVERERFKRPRRKD